MRLVLDSSAVVAMLADAGDDGAWVSDHVADGSAVPELFAPELLAFEVTNALRRLALTGALSEDEAALAHRDLLDLRVHTWPYAVVAERVWQLRGALTAYDAAYVAVAELLEAPLLTLDRRLARAPGPRCEILTPPR